MPTDVAMPDAGEADDEEAQRLLRAHMAHELKTAATLIYGWTDVLLQQWQTLDDDARRGAVDRIHRRAEQLVHHADQLLREGRAEATAGHMRSTPTDVAGRMAALARAFQDAHSDHTVL